MHTRHHQTSSLAPRALAAVAQPRGTRRPGRRSLPALLGASAAVAALAVPGQVSTETPGSAHVSSAAVGIPLEAQGAVSRAIGARERAYWARGGPQGLTASAPGLTTRFGRAGTTFATGAHTEVLRLDAVGRGGMTAPLPATAPRATRNRVVFSRGVVQEWYANGPVGLEQGFRVARRPMPGGGSLGLRVAARGDLHPVLDGDRLGLTFRARGGAAVLRYSGLSARDAAGRRVPAHLAVRGDHVLIVVDDARAQYPLVVDPFVQSAILRASDGLEKVGQSVAISADGSTIVVGGIPASLGRGYVFEKPKTGWGDMTEGGYVQLNSEDVAISETGDTIVGGGGASGASVYTRPAAGWTGQQLYTATATLSGPAGSDSGVAISGDTIVVSSAKDTVGSNAQQGVLHVFVKPAGGWHDATATALLTASDGAAGDWLGTSVAIDADTIVANAGARDPGAVYVFVRPPGGWASGTQTARLSTPIGTRGPFGVYDNQVAISGDTVVAGAPREKVGANTDQGMAYVWVKPPGGWQDSATPVAQLSESDALLGDQHGEAVGIFGSTIAVGGAKGAAIEGPMGQLSFQQPAVYVYAKPPGDWANTTETQRLTASDGTPSSQFGRNLDIGSGTIVVGAWSANNLIGQAYVFGGPPEPTPPVVTPAAQSPAPTAPPVAQQAAGALACTSAKVVLINVLQRGGKVLLTGAARAGLAGQTVKIKYLATSKIVATGTVGEGGLFSFTVPLPPAQTRATNAARYQAVLGTNVSLGLKLQRRAEMLQAKLTKGRVLLSGRVTGSFRPGTPVTINLRATCGAFKTVGKTRLSRTGTFRASVPALAGAAGQIAVYRARTTVLLHGRPQQTFTLPLPPTG